MPIIEFKSQLLEYFIKGAKKQDQLLIGVEHEKFLFFGKEKKRVNYEQIKKIFKNLETFGWNLVYEKENIIRKQNLQFFIIYN
jgi:gamma-glutamylcysteine synthetase